MNFTFQHLLYPLTSLTRHPSVSFVHVSWLIIDESFRQAGGGRVPLLIFVVGVALGCRVIHLSIVWQDFFFRAGKGEVGDEGGDDNLQDDAIEAHDQDQPPILVLIDGCFLHSQHNEHRRPPHQPHHQEAK